MLMVPVWADAIAEAEEAAGDLRNDLALRVRNHMVQAFPGPKG